MTLSNSKRPSAALIISAIALTFALVGTSVAADPVAKVNAKKVKKIAKQEISKAEPTLDVRSAKTADSAKSADSATSATSAVFAGNANTVGGLAVRKYSAKQAPGTALTDVATVGSLRIQAGCQADGDPLLTILPAANAATQSWRSSLVLTGDDNTSGNGQTTLPPAGVVLLDGSIDLGADGSFETLTTGGTVTTLQFMSRESGNFDPNEAVCVFSGTGITG